ncbi:hypothetical protein D3C80_1614490 [compost metagenome]
MILDTTNQRGSESTAATDWDTNSVFLHEAQEHEQANARAELLRAGEVFADHAREVQASFFMFKPVGDDFPAALHHGGEHLSALKALIHHGKLSTHWNGG